GTLRLCQLAPQDAQARLLLGADRARQDDALVIDLAKFDVRFVVEARLEPCANGILELPERHRFPIRHALLQQLNVSPQSCRFCRGEQAALAGEAGIPAQQVGECGGSIGGPYIVLVGIGELLEKPGALRHIASDRYFIRVLGTTLLAERLAAGLPEQRSALLARQKVPLLAVVLERIAAQVDQSRNK